MAHNPSNWCAGHIQLSNQRASPQPMVNQHHGVAYQKAYSLRKTKRFSHSLTIYEQYPSKSSNMMFKCVGVVPVPPVKDVVGPVVVVSVDAVVVVSVLSVTPVVEVRSRHSCHCETINKSQLHCPVHILSAPWNLVSSCSNLNMGTLNASLQK